MQLATKSCSLLPGPPATRTRAAPPPRRRRADVGDAAGDEAAALVVGDRRQAGRVEDAAVGVLDEVAPRLLVERLPFDRVGVGEDAVLEEALAAAHRQHRRVDREAAVGAHAAQEHRRAERALAAADDRHVALAVGGDAVELVAPAVAVEDAVGDRRLVREGAVDAGAGQDQGAAACGATCRPPLRLRPASARRPRRASPRSPGRAGARPPRSPARAPRSGTRRSRGGAPGASRRRPSARSGGC